MLLKHHFTLAILFILVFLCTYLILYPGQYGPFIIDDVVHLPKLAGGVEDPVSFYKWVFTTGQHGSGRMLSYLSFLIDDTAWPSRPEYFKHTNILIHLLVGLTMLMYILQLLRISLPGSSSRYITFGGLAIISFWLILPLHHSAIFMAIQRMTLLMALFVVIGLSLYVRGRLLVASNMVSGYLLMSSGIGLFGLLGVFFKEPAILICLYALVLEATILNNTPWTDKYKLYWKTIFLYLPLLLLIVFIVLNYPAMTELAAKREFSIYERLITQSRVIIQYIVAILHSSPAVTGPYFDGFVISRSILSPVSTLISIIVIIALLALAVKFAKKYNLISFGILFFFAGHALESTVLPIEIYFEHRNYLPSIGIFIALFGLYHHATTELNIRRRILVPILSILFLFQLYFSVMSSVTWGNKASQATVWYHYQPQSERAQYAMLRYWNDNGEAEKAYQETLKLLDSNPGSIGLQFYRKFYESCDRKINTNDQTDRALQNALANGKFNYIAMSSLTFIRNQMNAGRCNISLAKLRGFAETLLQNKKYQVVPSSMAYIHRELSYLYLMERNVPAAIKTLGEAYENYPDYELAITMAFYAMTINALDDAQKYLDLATDSPSINKYDFIWRDKEISMWQNRLDELNTQVK